MVLTLVGVRACVAIFLVVALAGCGSSQRPIPVGLGVTVFRGDCEMCHSLVGNDSERKQGGDLVGYRMSVPAMTQFAREMPSIHRLTRAELKSVVGYVESVERRARG